MTTTKTTLRDRAASALDRTHEPALAYRGPVTMKMRAYVAAWLDGAKIRKSMIRTCVTHLENIAGTCGTDLTRQQMREVADARVVA